MSMLSLCTHPQLKDVVFDILDVRDAMPLRLVSSTIRAAVEDFGLQVFAEGIEEENQTATEQHNKLLLGVSEKDDFDSNSRPTLFTSARLPWFRMFALIGKSNGWVVDDHLREVLLRVECIKDDPRQWQSELMYRCCGKGVLYLQDGLLHHPSGAESKARLKALLADVKGMSLTWSPTADKEILRFSLSCMPLVEVADLQWAPVIDDDSISTFITTVKDTLQVLKIGRRGEKSPPSLLRLWDQCIRLRTLDFGDLVSQEVVDSLAAIADRLHSLTFQIDPRQLPLDWRRLAPSLSNLRQLHVIVPNQPGTPSLGLLPMLGSNLPLLDLRYDRVDKELVNFLKAFGKTLRSLRVQYGAKHDYSDKNVQLMATVSSCCVALQTFLLVGRREKEYSADLSAVFQSCCNLRRLHLIYLTVTEDEILSIGHVWGLRHLSLTGVDGLTDKAMCDLAPKLPLLEHFEVASNYKITAVGVSAFALNPNRITTFVIQSISCLRSDEVVAAVVGNRALCRRLTKLSIKPCFTRPDDDSFDVVRESTLRKLAMACSNLSSLDVPKPPKRYSESVLRLFRWGAVSLH